MSSNVFFDLLFKTRSGASIMLGRKRKRFIDLVGELVDFVVNVLVSDFLRLGWTGFGYLAAY